jgi:hypothetical protein
LFLGTLFDSQQSLFGSLSIVSSQRPGSSNDGLETGLALPDTNGCSFDRMLATEGTTVSGVLGNFIFLGDLSQGSSVSGSVFADDSLLLGSLCHGL